VQYKSGATTKRTKFDESVMCIIFLSNVISVSESVLYLSARVRRAPTVIRSSSTAEYKVTVDTNLNNNLPVIKENCSVSNRNMEIECTFAQASNSVCPFFSS
jgi:hypothetical protein